MPPTKITVALTGHRLGPKIGGYSNAILKKLIGLCDGYFKENKPVEVITGGAIGFDQAGAIAAIRLNIPVTVAIPFEGQEKRWPKESQELYHRILKKAKNKVYVHKGGYEPWKMQARNEWMVDNAHLLLAYWDGKSTGGTYNCIEYGRNQDIPIVNLYDC